MNAPSEKDVKIVALAAAGVPLAQVAKEVGVSKGHVQYTMETKVERNTNGLGDMYDEFRKQMHPIVRDIVHKVLIKMLAKIEGPRVDLKDLIQVYGILAEHAGMSGSGEMTSQTQRKTATVDLKNPAVVEALRKHLVIERTEQVKALASGEKG